MSVTIAAELAAPTPEKTLSDAQTAITTENTAADCPWNAGSSAITVEYDSSNSNAIDDAGNTKADQLVTTVDTWLKAQSGFETGFVVSRESAVITYKDATTAELILTITKGSDTVTVTVSISASAKA